jgi:hypothetical protein
MIFRKFISNILFLFIILFSSFILQNCSSSGNAGHYSESDLIRQKCDHAYRQIEHNNYEQALDMYADLIKYPNLCESAKQNYFYLCSKLPPKECIERTEYFLTIYPGDTTAYKKIAYTYMELKEYDQSLIYLKKLLELPVQPENVKDNFIEFAKQNYIYICSNTEGGKDRNYLRYYLRKFPNDTSGLKGMVYSFFETKEYDSSLVYLKNILEQPGASKVSKQNFLFVCRNLNPDKGIKNLKYYLGIYPNDTSTLWNIAYLYMDSKKYDSSLIYWKNILELPRASKDTRQNYRYVCLNLEPGKGIENLKHYLKLYPDDEDAKLKYFYLCSKISTDSAINNMKNYLGIYPDDILAMEKLAEHYNTKKDYDSSFYYYDILRNKKIEDKKTRDRMNSWCEYLERFVLADKVSFLNDGNNRYYEHKENTSQNDKEKYLSKINYYRNLCNLKPVTMDFKLSRAAQAHADYLEKNILMGHDEDPKLKGFTGQWPWDRAKAAGYNSPVGEDIAFSHGEKNSIDDLMNSIYHRFPITAEKTILVGIGINNKICVILFGSEFKNDDPKTSHCVIYPIPGQPDFPVEFGEYPNPFPDNANTGGTPITLQFSLAKNITVDSYSLIIAGENHNVDCWLLLSNNDPGKLIKKEIAIVPKKSLKEHTEYNVYIRGKVDNVVFEKEWKFKTK